jgi:CPA2 family monovalent cation:H+ antiporter-2
VSAPINIPVYSDALVVLGTAGIVVPLARRFGLNPVLGYMGAGVVLGPFGLGSFIDRLPALYWVTVVDPANVAGIADLGVVFLLFLIGMELSFERLKAMRRLVFGLGTAQVLISTAMIAVTVWAVGQTASVAIVLGSCLALSSTAIVLEILSEEGRLTTGTGRTSFSVLLAQDIAVVPILMFILILGSDTGGSLLVSIATALAQAAAAVGLIVVVGRILLRPLFRLVATTRSTELFIATTLFVIVATGIVAALAGLSMALGAFVAGLLLATTEYRKAIEATVEPFKGLLLGIFFFSVGMAIDLRELAREPLWLLAGVVFVVASKALVLTGLGRLFRLPWTAAIGTGLLLGPGGEFAFVGIGLATTLGLVSQQVSSFTLAVTSLTMVLIPLLAVVERRVAALLEQPKALDPVLLAPPTPRQQHAIVVGYGRVGKVVCALLKHHDVPYTVADHDARSVAADRHRGHEVYYGDAASPAFLKACGLMEASAVVVTIHTHAAIDQVVRQIRELRSDIPIVSRARDAEHARHLYEIGVTDAVPETIEASLQLSEAALVGLGIPMGPVIASIHEQRDVFRRELQEAALRAGHETTRSIRAKAS